MTAVLDNACDCDARMIDRGECHEPSVIAISLGALIFLYANPLRFLDYLGGTGLTSDNHAIEPGGMSSAIAGINHANHSGTHLLKHRWIYMYSASNDRWEDFGRRSVDGVYLLDKLRLIEN